MQNKVRIPPTYRFGNSSRFSWFGANQSWIINIGLAANPIIFNCTTREPLYSFYLRNKTTDRKVSGPANASLSTIPADTSAPRFPGHPVIHSLRAVCSRPMRWGGTCSETLRPTSWTRRHSLPCRPFLLRSRSEARRRFVLRQLELASDGAAGQGNAPVQLVCAPTFPLANGPPPGAWAANNSHAKTMD